ncbi:MAG TPA: ELM1/GtrOC1 family putative glycosyltransferase [Geminicoccaceae bacterium]|nr:ELM1/GtrOC1 family putative glycosyltransferase [Geminicoccaceae bacterium]
MQALRKPPEQPVLQEQATPRVWLVLGDKRGDNGQVEMVAQALGWPCERRNLVMRPRYAVRKPWVRPSLHHIDLARSDPLEPPWPDLIITIGRRPSMAALWIARQSGWRTRLVTITKPSGMTGRFDLIIAGAETQMPPLPNVLTVTLPLMRIDEGKVAAAAEVWRPRLAELPRPLIAFMVGGPTGPFVFDDAVTARLLAEIGKVAAAGGTPYVSTSRRTPAATIEALQAKLPERARLFRWTPDAPDNPYLGLLGLADGFVVTGDSISMLVEIAGLRKPLAILELPSGWFGRLDMLRRRWIRRLFEGARAGGLRRTAAMALYGIGAINHTRDFAAFYDLLIERGLAVRAGEGFPPPRGEVPDELDLVVARIRALLA